MRIVWLRNPSPHASVSSSRSACSSSRAHLQMGPPLSMMRTCSLGDGSIAMAACGQHHERGLAGDGSPLGGRAGGARVRRRPATHVSRCATAVTAAQVCLTKPG